MAESELFPGVREIEHTADLGIEVRAKSLPELFHRAAAGTMALVRGRERKTEEVAGPLREDAPGDALQEPGKAGATSGERLLELEAEDVGALLVRWLRELLYLLEVEGLAYREARFEELEEGRLRARMKGVRDSTPQVRELKGVTYHGLEARREKRGWQARVIFDI